MENTPLRSSKEILVEKIKPKEKAEDEKPEVKAEKITPPDEISAEEAKIEEGSVEKMEKIAKKNGIDFSQSIEEKKAKIEELKSRRERMTTQAMGDFVQYMKTGKKPESYEVKDEDDIIKKEKKNPMEKSATAVRIDEIMNSGKKSARKHNVDKFMEKAFDLRKEEKMAEFELKIKRVTNPNDLINLVRTVDSFEGSQGSYESKDQLKYIKKFFEKGNKKYLAFITRSNGLRENVERVYSLRPKSEEEYGKKVA